MSGIECSDCGEVVDSRTRDRCWSSTPGMQCTSRRYLPYHMGRCCDCFDFIAPFIDYAAPVDEGLANVRAELGVRPPGWHEGGG